MELYYAFSVIIVLAALFSYINVRYVKLPMTIGIMMIAMMVSTLLTPIFMWRGAQISSVK